jgi:hypothetical protein
MARGRSGADPVLFQQPGGQHVACAVGADSEGAVGGEHSYKELKDERGLDHFEGRSWRGGQHHVTLVMLAYAFLA